MGGGGGGKEEEVESEEGRGRFVLVRRVRGSGVGTCSLSSTSEDSSFSSEEAEEMASPWRLRRALEPREEVVLEPRVVTEGGKKSPRVEEWGPEEEAKPPLVSKFP